MEKVINTIKEELKELRERMEVLEYEYENINEDNYDDSETFEMVLDREDTEFEIGEVYQEIKKLEALLVLLDN